MSQGRRAGGVGSAGRAVARRALLSVMALALLAGSGLLALAVSAPAGGLPARAAAGVHPAAASAAMTLTPSTGLVDGQSVTVVLTAVSPGSTYALAQCDAEAFKLLSNGQEPNDGCDARHGEIITVDAGGVGADTIAVQAVMTTSLGAVDCRAQQCFVAVLGLQLSGGPLLLQQNITFAADACAAAGSCQPAADAWDPAAATDNPTPTGVTPSATSPAPATPPAPAPAPGTPRTAPVAATPGSPVTVSLPVGQAGDLTAPGSVTGPYTASLATLPTPDPSVTGVGLLRLALSAPATSWGPGTPSSVVADATLTDTTTDTQVGATQQFVLYDGAQSFTYAGFIDATVSTADTYQVEVTAEAAAASGGLSQPPAGAIPTVDVVDQQLAVVDPTNAQYLAYEYAPVLYGRTTSALQDVPMLVAAHASSAGGGATNLSYTVIFSHENTGTGFLPFLEWSTWGRITDIETEMSFTVSSTGTVSDAQYYWGGEPETGFADSEEALQEVDEPFEGTWDGNHPVLRDATGNNDFADQGSTAFRFQMAPVAPQAPGANEDAVMDANPWSYQIMNDEVQRWYGDLSTNPLSTRPGQAQQYALVDVDTSGSGVSSIAVALQLSGGSTWYASDFDTGYDMFGSGSNRTTVKLPADWQSQTVTGVRVNVLPASAAASVTVNSLAVQEVTPDWTVAPVTTPTPTVLGVTNPQLPALVLADPTGGGQSVARGGTLSPLGLTVEDSGGDPLAGIPVTFTVGGSPARATFTSCSCSTVTVDSGADGQVSTGPATAAWDGAAAGTVTASVALDSATAAQALDFTLTGSGAVDPAYRLVAADGGVFTFGGAPFDGSGVGGMTGLPVVGAADSASGNGQWLVSAGQDVLGVGDVPTEMPPVTTALNLPDYGPVVGIARTHDGKGFWLATSLGVAWPYGDATEEDSLLGTPLNAPIVGIAAEPTGAGYWMVAADGGVFTFGGAPFFGSEGGKPLNAPVVGMAPTPDGRGYWLVAADGGVFTFGDAAFFGSEGGKPLNAPVVGMAPTSTGGGYWLVAADGGVFTFGDAPFEGSEGGKHLNAPVVAMTTP